MEQNREPLHGVKNLALQKKNRKGFRRRERPKIVERFVTNDKPGTINHLMYGGCDNTKLTAANQAKPLPRTIAKLLQLNRRA